MKKIIFLNLIILLVTVVSAPAATLLVPGEAKYSGGTGEPNDPYLIATAEDLNDIGNHEDDWDKHFLMVADINLADYTGNQFNIIGYFFDEHSYKLFTGVFDGCGHTISSFTYSSIGINNIGLFGIIGENAEIKDLGLIDPNIDGGTGVCIGSLVGYVDSGTITDCYVKGGDVSGDSFVGGFIGLNRGAVIRCYTLSSNVVSGGYYSGGFVGENYYGTIEKCFSEGSITGDNGIGGMVGVNVDNSVISNCYSKCTTSGDHYDIGGLVGINLGTISSCYATGIVDGNNYTGGLVGKNDGTVLSSFWDIQTSGLSTSDGGEGKTTAQMLAESTFTDAGWDFIEVWNMGENQTYPFLRTHPAGDINHDSIVNFYDFAILAYHWLEDKR